MVKKKVIFVTIFMILILLVLPLISINVIEPLSGMGLIIMSFFIINPIASVIISVLMCKEIKRVWFLPLVFGILFLVSYWIVLNEVIYDLWVYAIFYVILGYITMIIGWLVKRNK